MIDLRVLQFKAARSGTATPVPPNKNIRSLAVGDGGVEIAEVANLWRGQWGVSRGVNDLAWGVGSFETKIVSACPSGNILIFDTNKGKLGASRLVSSPRETLMPDREVSGGHPRPMNCLRLCQQPSHSHLLLTGGTEGQSKVWVSQSPPPSHDHSHLEYNHTDFRTFASANTACASSSNTPCPSLPLLSPPTLRTIS